ncbi:MAG: DNA-binding protein [Lachnospiraceae bacterium]|nr:DNA-binding protein [Lachnospiraceae bacterium]
MDDLDKKALLFDFYGELLTGRQRQIYDDAVNGDLSLAEIAAKYGITRQGASDQLRRTTGKLASYEKTLGMVKRYRTIGAIVRQMDTICETEGASVSKKEIRRFASRIRQALDSE